MPRSLFGRIVIGLLATIFITASGMVMIDSFTNPLNPRPNAGIFLSEAEYRYKTAGSASLSEYLQQLRGPAGPESFVTDSSGRDLVNGADRSMLVQQAAHSRFPVVRQGSRFFFFQHDDGGNWFFIETPPFWGRQWINRLWMLAAVLAFCYVLARYLTRPLQTLQSAVEQFGKGVFTARAGSTRKDEVGQLSRTFDQMAERIQTLVDTQRTLLRDISHELRSPLSRLAVAIELARYQPHNTKALDQIEKEGERLNTLVGEILSLARTENIQPVLECVPVHLNDVMQDLLSLCVIEARQRNCRLVLNSVDDVVLNGDEELLRRAFENIIRNALRYAPPETAVTIRIAAAAGAAQITVTDSGAGVPAESLSRIFEPFYRVDQARNRDTGGTGLGLAIAKRAVENHAGEIRARNLHHGFEIEIVLPCVTEWRRAGRVTI